MATDDIPAFSRTTRPSPFGKLDDMLDAMKIEGVVKDALRRKAASEELELSEFIRELLRVAAFGKEHVAKIHAERIGRIGRLLGE